MGKPMPSFSRKELSRLCQQLQTDSKEQYLRDINDSEFWNQVAWCLNWLPKQEQKKWVKKIEEITNQQFVWFEVKDKIQNACIRNKISMPWLEKQIKSKKGGQNGKNKN